MSHTVPLGFRLAGVHCGIKRNPQKEDLTLIVTDGPAVAAGMYTQNLVYAAPVAYDRARTPTTRARAIVVNSGNANACTGERGLADAGEMARLAAEASGCAPDEVLVMSTGIIGEFLPMGKIAAGARLAAALLARDEAAALAAARGIMTTDRFPKITSRALALGAAGDIRLLGLAKGAGMIGPRMATLLGVLLTDAPLTASAAQTALADAVEDSFNCISVEGHMSTNDTVLLLASGAAGGPPLAGGELIAFHDALRATCVELAKQIPDDGEGATHLIVVEARGCASREDARRVAQTIANSALVKTAVCGGDPNWGRVVSAAGYAGVKFDPARLRLRVNGHLLYENGSPVKFDAATVSASMKSQRETHLLLEMAEGPAEIRFWTSDLTHEYIKINADYHT